MHNTFPIAFGVVGEHNTLNLIITSILWNKNTTTAISSLNDKNKRVLKMGTISVLTAKNLTFWTFLFFKIHLIPNLSPEIKIGNLNKFKRDWHDFLETPISYILNNEKTKQDFWKILERIIIFFSKKRMWKAMHDNNGRGFIVRARKRHEHESLININKSN